MNTTKHKDKAMTTINHNNALITTLDRALSTCRPHSGSGVVHFTQWLLENLPDHLSESAWFDACGNLHIDARIEEAHRTLFIAHVDTVHHHDGKNAINKTEAKWSAGTAKQCLGADDGAGVALLMHMLHNGVPAYYIFSQGEEVGGIGAKFLAETYPTILAEFDRAIAFDRKGIDSVITHQASGRCCSDDFAQALAGALNDAAGDEGFFAPDSTGVYTDTAEFTELIPECTNISVGYSGAHGDKESLDMVFFRMLADVVTRIDWDVLPTSRDPYAMPDPSEYATTFGHGAFNSIPVGWSWDDDKSARAGETYTYEDEVLDALDDAQRGMYRNLIDMIAETVSPLDPSVAKKQINKSRLDEAAIDWAIDRIYEGVPPDQVLEDLFMGAQVH